MTGPAPGAWQQVPPVGRLPLRATRRGSVVIQAGVALLGLAILGHAPALILLGLVILGLPVAAALPRPGLAGLRLAVDAPGELTVGVATGVGVRLARADGGPVREVAVTVRGWQLSAPEATMWSAAGPAEITLPVTAHRHGWAQSLPLRIDEISRWSLWQRACDLAVALPRPIPALPQVHPVAAPAPAYSPGAGDEASSGRASPSGSFPRGTRPFRSGDEARTVDWRSTARLGHLTVREWDPPGAAAPWTAVAVLPEPARPEGAQPPGDTDGDAQETLLAALASLGAAAAREDRPLGLVTVGDAHEPIVTRGLDSGSFLTAFADVPVRTPASLSALVEAAARAAGPGGSVVLGVALGPVAWERADAEAALGAAVRLGTQLEVITSPTPGAAATAGVAQAFAWLAARCPVRSAGDVLR